MDAFKECLREKGIMSTWSQEQAFASAQDDVRSKLLKIADKKQVYQVNLRLLFFVDLHSLTWSDSRLW